MQNNCSQFANEQYFADNIEIGQTIAGFAIATGN
jgi:hypothetical protein